MVDVGTEIIKGRIFVAQIIEDDIFYIKLFGNELCIDTDSKAVHVAYDKLRQGKLLRIVMEVGEYTIIDNSARVYLQNNKFIAKAATMVLPSIAQRIVYNFYVSFRKQDHPIKAFKKFEQAKEWLEKFKD